MEFIVSYCTDKGIKRRTNQDSLMVKSIRNNKGRIGLFVVCDGMGGLDIGELASSTVINHMSNWFDEQLPNMFEEDDKTIVEALNNHITKINDSIVDYSLGKNIKIGTTLTALFCIYNRYYLFQVGDSRAYKISSNNISILTKDQTYVAREVERGNLTIEEAKVHPKRNILLQCIGANKNLSTVITEGELERDTMYMLCSDGLYHKIEEEEFIKNFNPRTNNSVDKLTEVARDTIELVKRRRENDNISVILVNVK